MNVNPFTVMDWPGVKSEKVIDEDSVTPAPEVVTIEDTPEVAMSVTFELAVVLVAVTAVPEAALVVKPDVQVPL